MGLWDKLHLRKAERIMGEHKIKEEQKKKAFEENPDDFVNVKDVLFIAMRGNENQMMIMNNCLTVKDAMEVKGWAMRSCDQRMDGIEIQRLKNPTIVKPGQNGNVVPLIK